MSEPLITVKDLRKVFGTGARELTLFDGLSFEVAAGEMLAITGESGSGKSTLLHMLGALDHATAGEIDVAGIEVHRLASDDAAAAAFRGKSIGFVWQFHHLLPEFSALENAAMPLLMQGRSQREARERAADWLAQVGLSDRAQHRSGELSGGEQQRIALARALITGPSILLADEPTGDLDQATAGRVFELLARLHSELKLTSVIVTHNLGFAARCSRILRLHGGRLEPVPRESLTQFV